MLGYANSRKRLASFCCLHKVTDFCVSLLLFSLCLQFSVSASMPAEPFSGMLDAQ